MTGVPATAPASARGSEAERRKGKKASGSKGEGARAQKVEDPATLLDRIRQGIATSGVVASDIVRFRPRGAIDRRIKVDYIADPDHSESVLLRLTQKGVQRQAAYEIVQRSALRVWDEGIGLEQALSENRELTALLSREELAACFDLGRHLTNADAIIDRALSESV